MLALVRYTAVSHRTFKNFAHKREQVPLIQTLWHGFLTFTFIGCCIEWKKLAAMIMGKDPDEGQLIQPFRSKDSLSERNK